MAMVLHHTKIMLTIQLSKQLIIILTQVSKWWSTLFFLSSMTSMIMNRILEGSSLLSERECMRSKYCPIHPCVEDIGGTIPVRLVSSTQLSVGAACNGNLGGACKRDYMGRVLGMMLVWVCCTDQCIVLFCTQECSEIPKNAQKYLSHESGSTKHAVLCIEYIALRNNKANVEMWFTDCSVIAHVWGYSTCI